MKKLLTLALILITGLNLAAAGRQHELKTGAFTSLEVINDIEVVCRFVPDSVGTVTFFCDESMADAIIFDRSKPNRLKVMLSPDFIDRIDELPRVYVYTDMLEHVESSSEKAVLVENPPKCPKLKGILIGNGKLDITGIDTSRLIGVLATGAAQSRSQAKPPTRCSSSPAPAAYRLIISPPTRLPVMYSWRAKFSVIREMNWY